MAKKENIVRFSATELAESRARGRSQTDLARLRKKTEADLTRDIAGDPDFKDEPENWYEQAESIIPSAKTLLSIRLDNDLIDWFRQQGPGYQTRINAVLRTFVQHATKRQA